MKIKRALYLAIIIGLLASMGAIPVLADSIDMWVHRARLTYTGRSSGGPDMMVAYIHIRDAELDMVEGAIVGAEWTLPDGTAVGAEAETNVRGIAEFRIFDGAGDYTICVIDVTADGRVYNASLNMDEDCVTYLLPPYPAPYPWPYDSKP